MASSMVWMPENYFTVCDLEIFTDQSADPVSPQDAHTGHLGSATGYGLEWQVASRTGRRALRED